MPFTPRSRIQAVLRGEDADRVPFSIYGVLFPRSEAERHLRNQGLAVLERIPLCRVEMPNVDLVSREYYERGVLTARQTARTPVGEVSRTLKLDPSLGTSWWDMDYFVKRPDDYRMGVTEDIPEDVRHCSLNVILQTLSEHGALPIQI